MPFFKSAIFFIKLIFIPIKVDFILISLNHFNRVNGKNSFMAPIQADLNKANKPFLFLEDTDLKGAYNKFPREESAAGFEFITFCLIVLKKIGISHNSSIKILKVVFFRNLEYKYLINMAGYTLSLFSTMFPTRLHFELQHGLIFNNRDWWMLNEWNKYQNCGILLHGQGFKEVLLSNKDYNRKNNSKLLIAGINQKKILYYPVNQSRNIIFTEQITIDNTKLEINEYIEFFRSILTRSAEFMKSNNINIYVKAHPRIPNQVAHRYCEFDFIKDFNDLKKLESNALLAHLTFNSSSVFEFSLKGIPSILIDGLSRRDPAFLFDVYKMPSRDLVVNSDNLLQDRVSILLDDYFFKRKSLELEEWADHYNEKYNSKLISEIEAS